MEKVLEIKTVFPVILAKTLLAFNVHSVIQGSCQNADSDLVGLENMYF
jgi:hypothetical protein